MLAREQLEGADAVVLLEQARIAAEPRGEARLGLVEVRGGDARVLVVVAEGGEQQRQALVGTQVRPKAPFLTQHVGHLGKGHGTLPSKIKSDGRVQLSGSLPA